MTIERQREIVNPSSLESLEQSRDKTHEEAERREKAKEIVKEIAEDSPEKARILREVIASGELNPAPRVEVEEPGVEAAV
jgi:hypothetical protein